MKKAPDISEAHKRAIYKALQEMGEHVMLQNGDIVREERVMYDRSPSGDLRLFRVSSRGPRVDRYA